MPKTSLKIVFEKFLNGHASKEDLENLMNSFENKEENSLEDLIYDELEKEDLTDQSIQYSDITNRVLKTMVSKRMEELYMAYIDQRISNSELKELNGYMDKEMLDKDLFPFLHDDHLIPQLRPRTPNQRKTKIQNEKIRRVISQKWLLISACIMLLLVVIIGIVQKYPDPHAIASNQNSDIVLPMRNQARILFEDGTEMFLLHTDRKVLRDRGIEIVELANNEIAFKIQANPNIYSGRHIFFSPKGTTSHLILADSTHVWLNSATELHYPSCFSESERRISILGEAYFEVHHDAHKPFIVETNGTQVKVLGTGFNIATNLKNNAVLTTLVHGSVEITTAQQKLKIAPGVQSSSNKNSGVIDTAIVDLSREMAWKSGMFKFEDDDIYSVLDKLKTWYSISDYEVQTTTTDRFSGTVKRTRKLSQLLANLEEISSYKFKIIDRRIIVMK